MRIEGRRRRRISIGRLNEKETSLLVFRGNQAILSPVLLNLFHRELESDE